MMPLGYSQYPQQSQLLGLADTRYIATDGPLARPGRTRRTPTARRVNGKQHDHGGCTALGCYYFNLETSIVVSIPPRERPSTMKPVSCSDSGNLPPESLIR